MQPYGFDVLMSSFSQLSPTIAWYLPRTSDLRQVAKYVDREKKIDVIHYCMDGASKALCTYIGDWKIGKEVNGT